MRWRGRGLLNAKGENIGFLHKDDPSASDLANKAGLALLQAMSPNPDHVIHKFLRSPKVKRRPKLYPPKAYIEAYINPLTFNTIVLH